MLRGDQVRDADGNAVEHATTSTGLVGFSATLFGGLRPGSCTSCADAVQAYLQAPIGKETWVTIPFELWLPKWKHLRPQREACGETLEQFVRSPR